ncbi:MAG: nucleotidyltransferase family protein [Lachnospiraceae bacterium]|nr:nucleotidyltransferase family protein [Lachnospiraceae bacterium]
MKEYYDLMNLLKFALNQGDQTEEDINNRIKELDISEKAWEKLVTISIDNSVAGLLYDVLKGCESIPKDTFKLIDYYATKACKRNYRYLVLAIQINRIFKKAGIQFCILKGMAAAADYPVPDVRKAADLDLLLTDPADLKRAVKLLFKLGFQVNNDEQHALHHVVMRHSDGVQLVEVHTMLAEPFDNAKTNDLLNKLLPDCKEHIIYKEIMGAPLPVLEDGYHAYEMLMHMLQHFMHAGFGVKMLCDWVVLWNRGLDDENRKLYMKLVKDSKVKGFADMISRVCIKYLGLKREKVRWMNLYAAGKNREEFVEETENFVKEIMEAGEFGKVKGRLVAFKGNGLIDYVSEFHHQMHINFPRAGKCFFLWPVLWIITLVRFLKNNKKVRSVSSREVFESARKRGKLVKSMHLFE